ncbi:NADPH dehydrogenase [compost metagenome]
MDAADISRTVAEYAVAASLVRDAGFDAIEIHMGHGYLLSQFISPALNRRRDAYGGSLENRMRLPLQVLCSAAGHYIGTADADGPVSRESASFFRSHHAAEHALQTGRWQQRLHP